MTGEALVAAADEIGYPVLVKAAFGGGGRGMRVVATARGARLMRSTPLNARPRPPSETAPCSSSDSSSGRATSRCRCSVTTTGRSSHLFERECSIQRRHQKVVEEAPSVALDDARRDELCDAAVAAAKAIGYVNAGTVEFVVHAGEWRLLVPGGEHSTAGRASRHRAGHRPRPRRPPALDRARRAAATRGPRCRRCLVTRSKRASTPRMSPPATSR